MAMLRARVRAVTLDVTGTLLAYKGQLGDYYCMSATAVGLPCPDYARVHRGFTAAYADMARRYPCFGFGSALSNHDWWRLCVRDSFTMAGYSYSEEIFEQVFKRIYAIFGSTAPYTVFPDAQPFLRWARSSGMLVAIVSNAEARYRDVILPALGLQQGSEWDVGVFSGVVGVEKPDARIYEMALAACGGVAAAEVLHIGDSWQKDYVAARGAGMRAVLLDRFASPAAQQWRQSGALVFPDLSAVQGWMLANCHLGADQKTQEP